MKIVKTIMCLLSAISAPLRRNGAFFVFMYVLGLVCTYAVVPRYEGCHAYVNVVPELFVDVYVLCLLLALLPRVPRLWVRRVVYVVAYTLAIVDVYCFEKFDSTITPTMILLISETNGQEAGEFLSSYLSLSILFSRLGRVIIVLLIHIVYTVLCRLKRRSRMFSEVNLRPQPWAAPILGVVTACLLVWCLSLSYGNKAAMVRLMSYGNIGDVEHDLAVEGHAVMYQPAYRLVFSVYANTLTARQTVRLVNRLDEAVVDSCQFRSRDIVLIIGESYNRYHSQLYGYEMPTTPRQTARAKQGDLVVFSDVVAPWNLTSFVFKHLFSLYTCGDDGDWCDYPLFPVLFRKAGYHVAFLTNQFLPRAKEAVYDFSGGFFLNAGGLSERMFDTRNDKLYYFDEGLLSCYDDLKTEERDHNLTIFHLKGQHVDYRTRCPRSKQHFKRSDYNRFELNAKQLQQVVYYDNGTLYNDSIVDQIIRRFENREAIVIYVPDHGEECYNDSLRIHGRVHSEKVTARLAREEFDIPMWIYCTASYREAHPDVYEAIVRAKDKAYMTDALAHTLLSLAGIYCKEYRASLDILSPAYDESRKRILKNEADYDEIKKAGR